MFLFKYTKPTRVKVSCYYLPLVISCLLHAANVSADWEAQLYGGEYYDDERAAAYGIATGTLLDNFTLTGEILYERYYEQNGKYDFSGAGAHLLWGATESALFGLFGSYANEEYDYDRKFNDSNSEDSFSTLGVEMELNPDPVTLAAQLGKISGNDEDDGDDSAYLAMDVYYWGSEYKWYARGAVRTTNNYNEYAIEGYRSLSAHELPVTLYVGATRNDLGTKEELRTYHTKYDSFYTGCYLQFLTTTSSRWTLWFEVAREDSDTVLSLELNLAVGPGAEVPYISAFGFTP